MRSDFRHTRPVTGLSLAREDAYDTDWGMSMLATVIPARKSPANLRRRVSQCVLVCRKVRTERTSTGVSKRWRERSIGLSPMSTFASTTEGGRPNLSEWWYQLVLDHLPIEARERQRSKGYLGYAITCGHSYSRPSWSPQLPAPCDIRVRGELDLVARLVQTEPYRSQPQQ